MEKVLRLLPKDHCEIYQLSGGSFVSKLFDGSIEKVTLSDIQGIEAILLSSGLCGWDSAEIKSGQSPDVTAFIFSQKRVLPAESFVWMPAQIVDQTISQVWTKRDVLDRALSKLGLSPWLPVLLEPQALRAQHYPLSIKEGQACWRFSDAGQFPHLVDDASEAKPDLIGLTLFTESRIISSLMNGHILEKPVTKNMAYAAICVAAVIGLILGASILPDDESQTRDLGAELQSQQKVINWFDENVLASQNLAMANSGTLDFTSGKASLSLDPLAMPVSKDGTYSEKEHSLSFSLAESK